MSNKILHVGCACDPLPEWLKGQETRLDIADTFNPDILANMCDMGEIGTYDIIYSSHNLEHLYPHDVSKALAEFIRVLNPKGYVVVFVPDLEDVKPTEDVIYESDAGPITGLDLFYGFRSQLKEFPYMAHHTGFTQSTLNKCLFDAGFKTVVTTRISNYSLMGVAIKE
jgi:ubiquinone/menaquinone biosynthesis C-methylase UbiE